MPLICDKKHLQIAAQLSTKQQKYRANRPWRLPNNSQRQKLLNSFNILESASVYNQIVAPQAIQTLYGFSSVVFHLQPQT